MKYIAIIILLLAACSPRPTEPKVNSCEIPDTPVIYTMRCKHVYRPNGEMFYAMAYVKVDRFTGKELPITDEEVKLIIDGKIETEQ